MKKSCPTIGIAIMTLNAEKHLQRCLSPWLNSPLKPRVLVVDSSSKDGTVAIALAMGVEVLVIPQSDFNHGATREAARNYLQTEIVVMVTPDAYAVDQHVLSKLIKPIVEGKASVAYARQVPHEGAGFFEAFPREFNYPAESHIRSIEDLASYGVYTFFCSNSCAAYLNTALDEVGGFPAVLLGEDTVATALLLRQNHKIAYVSEAVVSHSHRYSLWQEFKRNFDTGLARKEYQHLFVGATSDHKRGRKYVREISRYLYQHRPYLLPYAFLQTLTKWLGYRLGQASVGSPIFFKKLLSSQRTYWSSNLYRQQ